MISVKDLTKNYGTEMALKGVSFEVKDGEVLGFLGPNGAGKTTTMKIITGFMPPTSGTVTVDGLDIAKDTQIIQKKIGYLPETTPVYPELLVCEYLEFTGKMRGLKGDTLKGRIDSVVELVGLEKNFKKLTGNLSKGYKQRLGIAQAILHDPEILILDEPTIGLDPNQIIEIRELIKNIGKAKTIILCSHILSEVEATCNRVVIINSGELVADGTPEELISAVETNESYVVEYSSEKMKMDAAKAFEDFAEKSGVEYSKLADNWMKAVIFPKNRQVGIGQKIFEYSVGKSILIRELRRERLDLEDVFTHLTR